MLCVINVSSPVRRASSALVSSGADRFDGHAAHKVFHDASGLPLVGHLTARLGTAAASLGAALAVRHVMGAAFLGAPVADVRAQLAELLGERTVASDRVATEPADRRALDAAGRTAIFAFLADHLCETVAALGRAVVAGGDAVLSALVQMMTHVAFPLVEIGRYWRARNAYAIEQNALVEWGMVNQDGQSHSPCSRWDKFTYRFTC
jgi:hypothetical protein